MSKKEYSDEYYYSEYYEEEEENAEKANKSTPAQKEAKSVNKIPGLKDFLDLSTRHEFENAAKSYLEKVTDSFSNFEYAFKEIVREIVKSQGEKRAAILTSFVQFIKGFTGKIDSKKLYHDVLGECQQTNDPMKKMQRNSAIFLCLAAISRAGSFKTQRDVLFKIIKTIFIIGMKTDCARLLALQSILEILSDNEVTADEYKANVQGNVHGAEKSPENIDQLYFEIKLCQRYPEVKGLLEADKIIEMEELKKYTNVLKQTVETNGKHPIWTLLCEINYKKLYSAAVELWLSAKEESVKRISSDAIATVLKFATKEEFLEITRNNAIIETCGTMKNTAFSDAFLAAVEKNEDCLTDVIKAFLLGNYNKNALVIRILFEKLSKISDKETLSLIKDIDGMNFNAVNQILLAQSKREQLKDDKIIKNIFEAAIKKAEKESEKNCIVKFALSLIYDTCVTGKKYYTILTGKNTKATKGTKKNAKEMLNNENEVLKAINQILKKVGIEVNDTPEKFATTSDLAKFFTKIREEKLPYPNRFISELIEEAMPFFEGEDCKVIELYPLVVSKALTFKNTCPYAIDFIVTNFKDIPEKTKGELKEFDVNTLPLDAEEAEKIVNTAVNVSSINESATKFIRAVITKIPEQKKAEIINEKIVQHKDTKDRIECEEAIKLIVESSNEASNALVKTLAKLHKDEKKISSRLLHAGFNWIEAAVGKADSNELVKLAADLVPKQYPTTKAAGKSKETNLKWFIKVAKLAKAKPEEAVLKQLNKLASETEGNFIKNEFAKLMKQ